MLLKTPRSNSLFTIFVTVALALASCNRNTVYHHYEQVSANGWERNDTLYFHVTAAKSDAVLNEEMELRINNWYPFMGLCVVVEQTTFPSNVRRVDTLNCSLVGKNGITKGKGISYIQNSFHLTDISVSEGDSLDIAIHHNMKQEILPGVVDLGIKLNKN